MPPIPRKQVSPATDKRVPPATDVDKSAADTHPMPDIEEGPPIKRREEFGEFRRTPCPITHARFLQHAKDVPVTINGEARLAKMKEFKKKSFGWHLNDKSYYIIDGVQVKVQIGLTITIVGSEKADRT